MNEFKINNLISLKLENKKTNIYINNKRILQCKRLLIDLNWNESYDWINSVDDIEGKIDQAIGVDISPEIEFWGHCSNLQSWVENDYDTRLLDIKIAFPILKILSKTGDKKAKSKLSEEVVRRYNEGNQNVKEYIINENLLGCLDSSEIYFHILNDEDANNLINIIAQYGHQFKVESFIPKIPTQSTNYIIIKEKKIVEMGLLLGKDCMVMPKELYKFRYLNRLKIYIETNEIKNCNGSFPNIQHLSIYIKRPILISIDSLGSYPNLISFGAYGNENLQSRPEIEIGENLRKMVNLESLYFYYLIIKKLPEYWEILTSLKWLIIYESRLNRIPEEILTMDVLQVLNLEKTCLEIIPASLTLNTSINYFVCEPYLIDSNIKNWLKTRELEKFKENTYKKKGFLNFPVIC